MFCAYINLGSYPLTGNVDFVFENTFQKKKHQQLPQDSMEIPGKKDPISSPQLSPKVGQKATFLTV